MSIGLPLDAGGWAEVDALLDAARRDGVPIGRDELEAVVETNDKRRFELDPSGTRIRACQGHSIAVELGLSPTPPPEILFHGTVDRFLPAIVEEGLRPGGRRHVHLSADRATAALVGARRGRPVVLRVLAGRMSDDGFEFRLASNGVWLTDAVPARYLER